jgi:hypothetical protein
MGISLPRLKVDKPVVFLEVMLVKEYQKEVLKKVRGGFIRPYNSICTT